MATLTEAVVTSRGICSACKHEGGCIYPKDKGQLVLNCGQFELCPPIVPLPPSRDQVELEKLWEKSSGDKPGTEFKGLCSNCEERHTCIYPKPAEGVWHCEEYR
jgi:hypothetical protein